MTLPGGRTAGFTLIEVVVALMLGGMMALLAHGIFGAALHGSAEIQRGRENLDRRHAAHRFMAAMFLSVDPGVTGETAFDGDSDRVRFHAWLETPDGWFERRPVELSVLGSRLVATMPSSSPMLLMDSVAAAEFSYLLQPGAESRWVSQWVSQVTAPLAVRIRLMREHRDGGVAVDTMVYLIKERG